MRMKRLPRVAPSGFVPHRSPPTAAGTALDLARRPDQLPYYSREGTIAARKLCRTTAKGNQAGSVAVGELTFQIADANMEIALLDPFR